MAYPDTTSGIVFVKCSLGSLNLNIINHPGVVGENSLADSKLTRVVGAVSSMFELGAINSATLSAPNTWETWKTTDSKHVGLSVTAFAASCIALVFGL